MKQYIIKIALPNDYFISYTHDKKWHGIVQSMDRDDIKFFTSISPRRIKKMYKKTMNCKITTHWRVVTPISGPTNISLDW